MLFRSMPKGAKAVPKVSGGSNITYALKSDGTLWSWGYNGHGALGIEDTANKIIPMQIALTDVVDISSHGNHNHHALALKADRSVWSFGYNQYGQLGDGTTANRTLPVQVKGVGGSGVLSDIEAISAGRYHSLAIDKNGNVYVWGYNGNGELGDRKSTV